MFVGTLRSTDDENKKSICKEMLWNTALYREHQEHQQLEVEEHKRICGFVEEALLKYSRFIRCNQITQI